MKFLFFIVTLCSLLLLSSCGKGDLKIKLKNDPGANSTPEKIFRMSTQESVIEKYPVIEEVNLYELIPHLDSLPIHYDSFMEIYRVLELKGTIIQSRYVVLKKDPSCTSDIGYCRAVFLKR